jgi:hypothetical protein
MHFGDGQSWTTARRYIVCFVSVWVEAVKLDRHLMRRIVHIVL